MHPTTDPPEFEPAADAPAPVPRRTVRQAGWSRRRFLIAVGTIAAAGIAALLVLDTALQQDSFTAHDLRSQTRQLSGDQQILQQQLESLSAPGTLAQRARQLGMTPNTSLLFLQVPGGRVLGVVPSDAPSPWAPPSAYPATPGTLVVATSPKPTPPPAKHPTSTPSPHRPTRPAPQITPSTPGARP